MKLKNSLALATLLLTAFVSSTQARAASGEDWKGTPDKAHANIGALAGYGVAAEVGGFALIGTASGKILERGFVPDINNSVNAEVEVGPLFASGASGVLYGAHLRWDFAKDDRWSIYALGGLGGFSITQNTITTNQLYPRFGVGAIWAVHDFFSLRLELSHELTALGLMFYL